MPARDEVVESRTGEVGFGDAEGWSSNGRRMADGEIGASSLAVPSETFVVVPNAVASNPFT